MSSTSQFTSSILYVSYVIYVISGILVVMLVCCCIFARNKPGSICPVLCSLYSKQPSLSASTLWKKCSTSSYGNSGYQPNTGYQSNQMGSLPYPPAQHQNQQANSNQQTSTAVGPYSSSASIPLDNFYASTTHSH
jgi:hypothetical protein